MLSNLIRGDIAVHLGGFCISLTADGSQRAISLLGYNTNRTYL